MTVLLTKGIRLGAAILAAVTVWAILTYMDELPGGTEENHE